MMHLEAVELVLQISYGLTVRRHLRVDAVLVLHELIHRLRVAPDLEALDPEFNSDLKIVDQGFVLSGVVRCWEM
jgi:hypothetical protein